MRIVDLVESNGHTPRLPGQTDRRERVPRPALPAGPPPPSEPFVARGERPPAIPATTSGRISSRPAARTDSGGAADDPPSASGSPHAAGLGQPDEDVAETGRSQPPVSAPSTPAPEATPTSVPADPSGALCGRVDPYGYEQPCVKAAGHDKNCKGADGSTWEFKA
jgi:hypothetical protein